MAWQNFVAGLVTSWPVTHLMTPLVTLVMATFPRTLMTARHARFSARLITIAVHASIFALLETWRTRHIASLFTDVRTNQHPFTVLFTAFVNSTHSTLATISRALVTTFQSGPTRDWAIYQSSRAGNGDFMSTQPIRPLYELLTFSCAWLFTVVLAPMATG